MFTHGELVVDFVDIFVDPAMMQQPVQKVVPGVFNDSAAETLDQNIRPEEGDRGGSQINDSVQQQTPTGTKNRWRSSTCLTEG